MMMTDGERKEFISLGVLLLIPMCIGASLGKCVASYFLIGYSMLGYGYLQFRYWVNEYREHKGKNHVNW